MNPPRFEELLLAYEDDALSPEELADFKQLLVASPAARQRLVEAGVMQNIAASHVMPDSGVVHFPQRSTPWDQWRLLAAAATLAILAAGWWWQGGDTAQVAVSTAVEITNGQRLGRRPREISSGTVELLTERGARLVIEAPAKFTFSSAQRLRLDRGRLSADVPPAAHGFTVVTASGEVVDLGTRFGVDADARGGSEVHVFEGEVIAQAGQRLSLKTGDAAALRTAQVTRRNLRDAAFIQPAENASLAEGVRQGRQKQAAAWRERFLQDTALLTWEDFESPGEDGSFRRVQGRWPGSVALEFVEADDHARVSLNATTRKLTLMTWVRLDRVPEGISSLYHTDGWDTPGQVHWMILNDGRMRFAVHGAPLTEDHGKTQWPQSREPLLGQLGRWLHLAAVYDADTQQVSFFTNGQFDSAVEMKSGLPAVLGPAQIGNWNVKHQHGTEHRRLSGRMDELVAISRCLSAEVIRQHYEAGNPYR